MKSSLADNKFFRGVIFCSWLILLYLMLAVPLSADAGSGSNDDVWDSKPLTLSGFTVQVQEAHPDRFDWPDLVKALIDLHLAPGQVLTRENLAAAEKAVSPFGRVRSQVSISGGQADVVFFFSPYKLIKSISIRGNYPLFERDVRTALDVAVGDIFRRRDMSAEKERVIQLYQSRGFIDPKVEITWRPDASDGHQQLRIAIDTGAFYRIATVTVSGNKRISDTQIKARLSVWRQAMLLGGEGRFEPLDLKEDIQKLTGFYRRSGFYNARIKAQTTLDRDKQQADVALSIDEGPFFTVAFEGNSYFSEAALRKDLVLEENGNLENRGLRRSVQALRKRYLGAGFNDVDVNGREIVDKADENNRIIVFTIHEGLRRIVNKVSIRGTRALDKELVREQILTRPPKWPHKGAYVKQVLEEDLTAVRALYLQHGFLSAHAAHELRMDDDAGTVDVTIVIDEGVRTRVRKVAIKGKSPIPAEKLKQDLLMKPGDDYRPYMIREEENNLTARIAELGYPHVQATGAAELSEDQTRADIVYTIDSGPLVKLGEIFILGNFRTRKNFIKYQLGLKPNEVFSLKEVTEGQRKVRDLRVFDSVQLNTVGLREKAATVPLLITVAEKKPYFFELGGGYQSDKGIYGRTKVGDTNVLGSAKQLWTGLESSQAGYRWDAGFHEPRLLGIRLGLDIGLFAERSEPFNQDFGSDTSGGTIGISRKWGQFFNTHLGMRYEKRQQFRQNDRVVVTDPVVLEERTVWVTTPAVTYDNRDSFIRPRKGLLTSLAVDISKGLDSELDDFLKYRLDARWFQPLADDLVLAARLGIGYLQTYGETTEPPQDHLFYLGGTTTVRGFAENLLRHDEDNVAVGGKQAVWGSVEGRYELWHNWELALFVDTGSISQAAGAAGSDDFRWSTGLGMEYVTPIGPIGLFYGYKLNPLDGESPGYWHFSIGYTF